MEKLNTSRRKFIQNSLIATGGLLLAPNFISCSDDDIETAAINTINFISSKFSLGVASFDPTASKVIIWTRYTETDKEIFWEVATDFEFKEMVRSGAVKTEVSRDNTIAIELTELPQDTALFYRFINKEDKQVSVVGETITLPENASQLKLAVCSCSNFQAGLFNVYNAMAKSEADIIVHLGDYFYEYGSKGYGYVAALERDHEPAHEILTLEDYRTRYKQYRSDKDLQLAHRKKPFICVWDDHEVANDTYKDGAQNHDEATEGSFQVRKENALKAYSEFLPFTQLELGNEELIYRAFNLGNLVDLIMLDTRVIGRDKQLDSTGYFVDNTAFKTALNDSSRTLLGTKQKNWLMNQLTNASAKWQVFGQQVLMSRMTIPDEVISSFGAPNFNTILTELVTIKARVLAGDPTVTNAEKARISEDRQLAYNMDAWDGYPAEREEIYNSLGTKKIVNLAGDTHNGWSSKLTKEDGTIVGVEVATASVSSPGFESFIGGNLAAVSGFQTALTTLIDDLNYFNASKRGFVLTTFTQADVKAEWIYVDTVVESDYSTETEHSITFS